MRCQKTATFVKISRISSDFVELSWELVNYRQTSSTFGRADQRGNNDQLKFGRCLTFYDINAAWHGRVDACYAKQIQKIGTEYERLALDYQCGVCRGRYLCLSWHFVIFVRTTDGCLWYIWTMQAKTFSGHLLAMILWWKTQIREKWGKFTWSSARCTQPVKARSTSGPKWKHLNPYFSFDASSSVESVTSLGWSLTWLSIGNTLFSKTRGRTVSDVPWDKFAGSLLHSKRICAVSIKKPVISGQNW